MGTTNVIPTSQIADNEVWICSIEAYDGTEYSPVVTATTTVGANVEAAVGQDLCASAGLTSDGNYDLLLVYLTSASHPVKCRILLVTSYKWALTMFILRSNS